MSPYAAVNYIIKGIGYEEYYKEYILTHRINGTEAYDKIEEFKEMAKQFDTIDNWLEYINNNNISMNNSKNAALVENIKASKILIRKITIMQYIFIQCIVVKDLSTKWYLLWTWLRG